MKDENRTILIVDDEEMVLDIEALILERMGFKTLKATRPSERIIRLIKSLLGSRHLLFLLIVIPVGSTFLA